jgi:hypothetical protein
MATGPTFFVMILDANHHKGDDLTDIETIIASLEQQRTAIERALEALREVGSSAAPATKKRGRPAGKKAPGTKRVLSPEGREAIIAATKRRWAAVRKGQKSVATKRGGLTAAGRKRLSEAMKARWASKNPPKKVAKKTR